MARRKKGNDKPTVFARPLSEIDIEPTEKEVLEFQEAFGTTGQNTPQIVVSVSDIVLPESQPRKYFDEEGIKSLSYSIKENGLLQPLVVRRLPSGREYELIAGERRLRALKHAKIGRVPVIVMDVNDAESRKLQLVENLQREDLNPLEETLATLELIVEEIGGSITKAKALLYGIRDKKTGHRAHGNVTMQEVVAVEAIFNQIGKFSIESFIRNRLPLLNLPNDVLSAVKAGDIAYTKAIEIGKKLKENEELRAQVLQRAITEKLSLREIKQLIADLLVRERDNQGDKEEAENPEKHGSPIQETLRTADSLIADNNAYDDEIAAAIVGEMLAKLVDYFATQSKTA